MKKIPVTPPGFKTDTFGLQRSASTNCHRVPPDVHKISIYFNIVQITKWFVSYSDFPSQQFSTFSPTENAYKISCCFCYIGRSNNENYIKML